MSSNKLLTAALLLVSDRETETGETVPTDQMASYLSRLGGLRYELLFSPDWRICFHRKDDLTGSDDPIRYDDFGSGESGWSESKTEALQALAYDIQKAHGYPVGSDENENMAKDLSRYDLEEVAIYTDPDNGAEVSVRLNALRDRFIKVRNGAGMSEAFAGQTGRKAGISRPTFKGSPLAKRS